MRRKYHCLHIVQIDESSMKGFLCSKSKPRCAVTEIQYVKGLCFLQSALDDDNSFVRHGLLVLRFQAIFDLPSTSLI